ncbi:hypothetical protein [Phenylobacterium soli]|uniref:Uncharacterized protein n=1 Tax=Phenylobacterium soli TaxID=2170551 RepID=A0A328AIY8_9CAUL|nr:hypothetical protein [Phenylobacterium soli]RAK54405.1 hypothetical protein DJ017_07655 [Phenylobacterium soli]
MRELNWPKSIAWPQVEIRVLGAALAAPIVLFFSGDPAGLIEGVRNLLREVPEGDRIEVLLGAQLLAILERAPVALH